ncbi:NTP pyrophosphohydrolase-like protein [Ignavibacterium album JCM 16511]|uniref:NTP pyrophosphohydrolase-like protein n=1 Tax=Ignavibacterium album (strain DSM 19864 / JCM 16511 / NBRC 101810 / Mat9-16) TaxID=945713 RepID=I0AJ86_IGNAJ|nr:NUDIX hydrolase [Ignavibacterium album]AFH49043.1 NTP pyrophosphohydrolase-like protein [Ignavibacterium album JCM 16511]
MEVEFTKSAVIPYRLKDGKLEILLVTSIKKKNWIVPKGYIEFNLTPFESAKKEAYEEAGVVGSNETVEVGQFVNEKKNGKELIKVYTMEVDEELDDYPEKNLRKRKWFGYEEAIEKVQNAQIKNFLKKLKESIKN